MLKRLAAALVITVCFASAGCATSKFGAITFLHSLEMHEEHNLVREWKRFDSEKSRPYFKALVDYIRKDHKVVAVDGLGFALAAGGWVSLEDAPHIWGFNTGGGSIYIEGSLGWDEAFATLIHELGHSLQPEELDGTDDAQVFAEAIAYIVCYRLGIDTKVATFPYLQDFKNRHRILHLYSKQIDTHVDDILKALVK
jgi:hypothetical protein